MGQRLEAFKALMDERDRRYSAELQALRELTAAELKSVRDAVGKSEEAQRAVNVTQNEFRGSLSDVTGTMMPRKETESLVAELRDRIGTLASRSQHSTGASSESRYVYERLLAIVAVLVAIAAVFWRVA